MQNVTPIRLESYPVRLSPLEICLVLGATAETLEECRQPYTAADLKALVHLHARLLTLLSPEAKADYALNPSGAVVVADDPWCVLNVPILDDASDEEPSHA